MVVAKLIFTNVSFRDMGKKMVLWSLFFPLLVLIYLIIYL